MTGTSAVANNTASNSPSFLEQNPQYPGNPFEYYGRVVTEPSNKTDNKIDNKAENKSINNLSSNTPRNGGLSSTPQLNSNSTLNNPSNNPSNNTNTTNKDQSLTTSQPPTPQQQNQQPKFLISGKYNFPNGDTYVGHFWDRQFHGSGTIYFREGRGRMECRFERGILVRGRYVFEDGLVLADEEDVEKGGIANWTYCRQVKTKGSSVSEKSSATSEKSNVTSDISQSNANSSYYRVGTEIPITSLQNPYNNDQSDRRFYSEIVGSLEPAGKSKVVNNMPPFHLASPVIYDVGDGFFDAGVGKIFAWNGSDVLRIPRSEEIEWILKNCRHG